MAMGAVPSGPKNRTPTLKVSLSQPMVKPWGVEAFGEGRFFGLKGRFNQRRPGKTEPSFQDGGYFRNLLPRPALAALTPTWALGTDPSGPKTKNDKGSDGENSHVEMTHLCLCQNW